MLLFINTYILDCIICLDSAKKFLKHQFVHLHTNECVQPEKSNTIYVSESGIDYEIIVNVRSKEKKDVPKIIKIETVVTPNTSGLTNLTKKKTIKKERSKEVVDTYKCSIESCNKGFMTKSGLKRHQKINHQEYKES